MWVRFLQKLATAVVIYSIADPVRRRIYGSVGQDELIADFAS